MTYKVICAENIPIGDFKAIEHKTVHIISGKHWISGGLLYYYVNRFEVKNISIDTIREVIAC